MYVYIYMSQANYMYITYTYYIGKAKVSQNHVSPFYTYGTLIFYPILFFFSLLLTYHKLDFTTC